MNELINIHASKLRILFGSIIIVASLALGSHIISNFSNRQEFGGTLASTTQQGTAKQDLTYTSPNAVTSGMAGMAEGFMRTADNLERSLVTTITIFGRTAMKIAKLLASSAWSVTKTAYRAAAYIGSRVASGIVFIIHLPIRAVVFASTALTESPVVTPAQRAEVPVIDTQLAELYATERLIAKHDHVDEAPQTITESTVAWPIRGRLTTEFGVPHRPYQDTHTGIDISSGSYSGSTSVHPFKAGVVTNVIRSRQGLGNYVVVDHGNGLTSLYAHLYSISVEMGQQVSLESILGTEGSTGVSTGTHLHFEIRLHGQAVDPLEYLGPQP
jgi:murein DD-endopeptidase MepM/ murein hydrolase activator NlpD